MMRHNDLRILDVEFNDINGAVSGYTYATATQYSNQIRIISESSLKEEKLKLDSEQPYRILKSVFRIRDELTGFSALKKKRKSDLYLWRIN